jgi:putative transcriptional regulator
MMARKISNLTQALLETAEGMRASGILDDAAHAKITLRHLDSPALKTAAISGEDIRAMRERANISQAVLARYLNVTVGYVSQLERGTKRPTGPALALLDVIRRKGIDAIL